MIKAIMSSSSRYPSNTFVKELATEPDWYTLGYLLNVPKYKLDTINIEHRVSGGRRCLIEVFDYLHKADESPSWEQIVSALHNMGRKQRAKELSNRYGIPPAEDSSSPAPLVLTPSSSLEESDEHQDTESAVRYDVLVSESVACKYKALMAAFTRLVIHVKKALESNPQIEELQIAADQMLGVDPLPEAEATFVSVFTRLQKELSVLNYSFIGFLVKEFASENAELQREFIKYEKLYKNFERSAKMKELKQTIQTFQQSARRGKLIRLKLKGHWGEHSLQNFKKLVKNIMCDAKCLKLKVTDGCLCVCWEVPDIPISHIIGQLARSAEFMNTVGVISLMVGKETIYEGQDLNQDSSLESDFISAIEAGQMEAACVLLAVCDDPFSLMKQMDKKGLRKLQDSKGWSLLHFACSRGYTEVVEAILSMECFPHDVPDKNDWTPLMVAINNFHIDIAKLVITRANVNIPNKDGTTPIYVAAQTSQSVVVYYLLQAGADPRVAKQNGMTPLMIASKNGSNEIVSLLIEKEAGIDAVNEKGMTAIDFASSDGHSEVVSLLIETGANPETPNDRGYTPLMSASEKGFSNVVDVLAPKVDVTSSNKNGLTALHRACMLGFTIVVSTLILSGADPLAKVKHDGFTPFLYACDKGHDAVINTILQLSKPDVVSHLIGGTTYDDKTGLYYASRKGSKSSVITLLKHRADPNCADKDGSTPLMVASYKGFTDIVELLLKHKARVNDRHKKGTAALHLASDRGHTGVVLLLLHYKAKVDLQSYDENTALHMASRKGHKEIVKALIEDNADVTLTNSKGRTARDIAVNKGYRSIAVLIDMESSDTGVGTLSTVTSTRGDSDSEPDEDLDTYYESVTEPYEDLDTNCKSDDEGIQ